MPRIVWTTRPDGWNIYFNQQWVDYTGLTLEESYGEGSIEFTLTTGRLHGMPGSMRHNTATPMHSNADCDALMAATGGG